MKELKELLEKISLCFIEIKATKKIFNFASSAYSMNVPKSQEKMFGIIKSLKQELEYQKNNLKEFQEKLFNVHQVERAPIEFFCELEKSKQDLNSLKKETKELENFAKKIVKDSVEKEFLKRFTIEMDYDQLKDNWFFAFLKNEEKLLLETMKANDSKGTKKILMAIDKTLTFEVECIKSNPVQFVIKTKRLKQKNHEYDFM